MAEKIIIELGGKQLLPRELTFREVEMLMEDLMVESPLHGLESMCPEEPVSVVAVALSVGTGVENIQELAPRIDALKDLVPSLVPELFKQVRVANPFFAEKMENLAAIGKKLLESQIQKEHSTTSDAPPAG